MKEPQTSEDAEQTAAAQTQQIVADWDGEEDRLNPLNWSLGYKWCHILLVSLLTFVISLSSSMLAPAIPQAAHDLKTPTAGVESFILSAYVIGYSLGPLLVAPLSELYGRSLVYQVSMTYTPLRPVNRSYHEIENLKKNFIW